MPPLRLPIIDDSVSWGASLITAAQVIPKLSNSSSQKAGTSGGPYGSRDAAESKGRGWENIRGGLKTCVVTGSEEMDGEMDTEIDQREGWQVMREEGRGEEWRK